MIVLIKNRANYVYPTRLNVTVTNTIIVFLADDHAGSILER